MRIRRARGGTEVTAEAAEAEALRQVVGDLLALLGTEPDDGPGGADADPLAALVGLSSSGERPQDPALVRLLPDAYGDDEEAAGEFRRYTEADLRAGKRGHAEVVLGTAREGVVVLDRDQADAWLGTLNDLRLVLGVRLGVRQDADPEDASPEALGVYHWLGWVQDALLATLSPRAQR